MADHSTIEWTDATWNPIVGCDIVSPGCRECYAMGMAARIEAMTAALRKQGKTGAPHYDGTTRRVKGKAVWTGKLALAPEAILTAPLTWKRPRKIFVNSMGDLFHENVPDEWIDTVFAVMALAPQHTFQVLTKRSERMRRYLTGGRASGAIADAAARIWYDDRGEAYTPISLKHTGARQSKHESLVSWPLPNVWLGVSAEDQARADQRIPDLLATPAAVRWISAEPLLGPIDFEQARNGESALDIECWGDCAWCEKGKPPLHNCQRGRQSERDWAKGRSGLDWIVVGGESGPDARPMHPDWARQIRDQCQSAGVPFFFKQWGSWAPVCAMSEEAIDAAYHPAPARDPEAIRRCRVDKHVLHVDGSRHDPRERIAFQQGTGAMTMLAIGKKAAGRLLDGVEHSAMPGRPA